MMNDRSNEILAHLKKIAAWADLQSKIAKWSMVVLVPFLIFAVGLLFYFNSRISELTRSGSGVANIEWFDVTRATRKGDLEKALSLANDLLERTPLDFEGHYKKGEILLMQGDREGALKSFQKAKEIFPITKYHNAVIALTDRPHEAP